MFDPNICNYQILHEICLYALLLHNVHMTGQQSSTKDTIQLQLVEAYQSYMTITISDPI